MRLIEAFFYFIVTAGCASVVIGLLAELIGLPPVVSFLVAMPVGAFLMLKTLCRFSRA